MYMPTTDWWIVLLCLGSIAIILSLTISNLQGLSTLISQQEAQLKELCASLSEICKAEGPWSAEQLAVLELSTSLSLGLFFVEFSDATTFIQYQRMFVIGTLEKILPESTVAITQSDAKLFTGFYAGIVDVVATRDSNNKISIDVLPPILTHSLAAIYTKNMCKMICPHLV